ncbi:uncharacterized protein I303_103404 [Kwoniella dejecticola CBS 10117]|uniref:Uncharacterized protein n=1 Tax=Kwoniella dejecticola CBS 10117 TaxID=1296121 RepID=A0A1A6A6M8_9TREE|nr:uncharacterized protein I303_03427 [Kwoniella dejecticola CBS 10117]OBR85716.1 hypothetical protein I303_03427 [Kwoniella dejecticola CBS 10117]
MASNPSADTASSKSFDQRALHGLGRLGHHVADTPHKVSSGANSAIQSLSKRIKPKSESNETGPEVDDYATVDTRTYNRDTYQPLDYHNGHQYLRTDQYPSQGYVRTAGDPDGKMRILLHLRPFTSSNACSPPLDPAQTYTSGAPNDPDTGATGSSFTQRLGSSSAFDDIPNAQHVASVDDTTSAQQGSLGDSPKPLTVRRNNDHRSSAHYNGDHRSDEDWHTTEESFGK